MGILLTLVSIMAIFAVIIVIMTLGNVTMSGAQQLPSQSSKPQAENGTFRSINDSFSVAVPQGWVVEDLSSTDTNTLLTEIMEGYRTLARLCPQEQAIPGIGSGYACEEGQNTISINQYPNLGGEPEFSSIANNNIITNDNFLNYQIHKLQGLGYSNINIVNNTEMNINVTGSDINRLTGSVPAKLVEITYGINSTQARAYMLLSATNATSKLGLISGYSIFYEGPAAMTATSSLPEPVKQVFQSFEFVKEDVGPQESRERSTQANSSSAVPATVLGKAAPQDAVTGPLSVVLQHQNMTAT
jgi:hypothetical protein